MSSVEDLVRDLCPNGVPYAHLGDLCEVQNGFAFKSELFNSDGVGLPLIRIRDINTGFSSTYYSGEFDRGYLVADGDILIGMDGDFSAARWKHGTALLNQRVCRLQAFNEHMLPEFLFYKVQDELDRIQNSTQGSTVKHLSSRELERSRVPVPPVDVQRTIVETLDRFKALETELAVELDAELWSRRRQYGHHRDELLDFDGREDVRWMPLVEVAQDFGRGKSKHRPRNDPKLYGGEIPFIQTGDIRNAGHVISEFKQTYSQAGLAQSKLWPAGTLCITIAANIAETTILGFDSCFPDSVIGFVADPARADVRFVEHLLIHSRSSLQAQGRGSAQSNINLATFENTRLPFPPIREQARIASMLDKLDALVFDLSRELTAEIGARHQQYSHYRDRLLSFEEAMA